MKKAIAILLSGFLFQMQVFSQIYSSSPWHNGAVRSDSYAGVAIANGRIGMLSSEKLFTVKEIILNNVFDTYMWDSIAKCTTSQVQKGINFGKLNIWIDGVLLTNHNISDWQQALDMKNARLITSFTYGDKARISYEIYALKNLPYAGLIKINVIASKDLTFKAEGMIECPSEYKNPEQTFKTLKDNDIQMPLLQTNAFSPSGKIEFTTTAAFVMNESFPLFEHITETERLHGLDFTKKIQAGQEFEFSWCGGVCNSKDMDDPRSESERLAIYIQRGNMKELIERHQALWNELWKNDIVIEGDLQSQKDIRLSLYHLYAFSDKSTNLSMSPMGLSSQGYNGHVFWDTELWMFPPLLLFDKEISESLLNYRLDRLEKARQKARNYGYQGAMFPWESDDTGEEATPTFALTGAFEHHITADIAIAFWNYYRVYNDKEWLIRKAYPLLKDIADFWCSRVKWNDDGSCSILNVVGADEFAPNVNDNAFTNGSAFTALQIAVKTAVISGVTPDKNWEITAKALKFNYFSNGVMKEHETYNGEIIKQADVNLLSYPLDILKDSLAMRKNLVYYENKMSPEGPAMGNSVLAILYARLQNSKKAWELFQKSYIPNKKAPFGALSESPNSNNPYFATGAGGMLQAVIFGFAGIELTDHGIIQGKPCLPEHWKKLEIQGMGAKNETITILNSKL